MNVWTYWAGPMPEWIGTCLESMRRECGKEVGCKLHILTPESVHKWVGRVLHPRWKELPPGTGTDCLRAALLATYGGLWVDADTVMVRSPKLLEDRYDTEREFLYSVWPKEPTTVIAGYVYSPAPHPVAKRWLEGVNSAMKYAENVGWGNLGEKMLTPFVLDNPTNTFKMSLDVFMPISVDEDWGMYFENEEEQDPGGWRRYVAERTIAFGLNYSRFETHKPAEMRVDYKSGDGNLLIHKLLRDGGVL